MRALYRKYSNSKDNLPRLFGVLKSPDQWEKENFVKVTNNTSYALIAFGVHTKKGYGDDVTIPPGETAEVNGPYLGKMDGCNFHVALSGEIKCQETSDDDNGFQVTLGNPLALQSDDRGITVRHHADKPEDYVARWRLSRPSEFMESILPRLDRNVV